MIRRPPRSPLFPSTPLFRSRIGDVRLRAGVDAPVIDEDDRGLRRSVRDGLPGGLLHGRGSDCHRRSGGEARDRKSTRLNSSHLVISYAVFCLKKKNTTLLSTTRTWVPRHRRSVRSNASAFSSRPMGLISANIDTVLAIRVHHDVTSTPLSMST